MTNAINNPGPHGSVASPFALAELSERCMGDASLALLLLDKFEKQLRKDIVALGQQVEVGDAGQIARTAHALKGAAGAVAATTLYNLASAFESSARQAQLDVIGHQIASLRGEVDRCLNHLPAARASLAGETRDGQAFPGTTK